MNNSQSVHTEHVLLRFTISDNNVFGLKLYRAPTDMGSSGTKNRLPNEVDFSDLLADDIIVAVKIESRILEVLQFWRVISRDNDEIVVMVNNIIGSGYCGEFVFDRMAGLAGA